MIEMIVACDANGAIGFEGPEQLPWHIEEDLKFFKNKTINKTIVMGYNTWLSLDEDPLPGRLNVVMSSKPRPKLLPKEIGWCNSITEVLQKYEDFIVIGGSEIYNQFIDYTDILYITWVGVTLSGDDVIKFPINKLSTDFVLQQQSSIEKEVLERKYNNTIKIIHTTYLRKQSTSLH